MIFEQSNDALIFLFGVILLIIVGRIFIKPIKFILKLLLNSAIGLLIFFALSYFGKLIGLIVNINIFNIVISAILGIPGVILILLLKLLGYG